MENKMRKIKDWHFEVIGYVSAVIILLSALVFTIHQMEKQDEMIMQYIIEKSKQSQ
jgi:uncharacterized membrane protein YkvI